MLKRFFIGLIILSALASEGVINFPGNVYNFLSCLNSGTELSGNQQALAESSNEFQVEDFFTNHAINFAAEDFKRISFDYSKKWQLKNELNADSVEKHNLNEHYSLLSLYDNSISISSPRTVLDKADSSPPIL